VSSLESAFGLVGWDVRPARAEVARVEPNGSLRVASGPLTIHGMSPQLVESLRVLHRQAGGRAGDHHAVCLAADLFGRFRFQREGVEAVIDALRSAFPGDPVDLVTTEGRLVSVVLARQQPMAVAGTTWAATARAVARHHLDCILIDIGPVATNITPIVGGELATWGRTGPERHASGELVPTGSVRTPVDAVLSLVPWRSHQARVAAGGVALMGDVYLWSGELAPDGYTGPTPDGRPADRPHAGERLARLIGGDRELIRDGEIDAVAGAAANAQVGLLVTAAAEVRGRHPGLTRAVIAGPGEWIGRRAAERAGLTVTPGGAALSGLTPAVAAAMMIGQGPRPGEPRPALAAPGVVPTPPAREPRVGLVLLKVGGGLLQIDGMLSRLGPVIAAAARSRPLVVLPGGGPFADQVRQFDRDHGLSHEAAHWMAILAMDQYAWVLASRIPGARLVTDSREVAVTLAAGLVPVLAPARWLRDANELPHSWDVTSDSIAAYLAGLLSAEELVLLKPVGGGEELLDSYFARALPAGLAWSVVAAEAVETLAERLRTSA
jgi:probable H4MPT-linked C1 transfer pathway protein